MREPNHGARLCSGMSNDGRWLWVRGIWSTDWWFPPPCHPRRTPATGHRSSCRMAKRQLTGQTVSSGNLQSCMCREWWSTGLALLQARARTRASSDPWEFERDKFIHSESAVITRLDENGKAESHTLEAEYIPIGLSPKEDFYEKELKRKVSKYGNIAQVWSAFEIRTDPKTESNIRGLNSIQLHYENGRWWIDSWTCEMESEKNNLVTEFLNKE